MRRIRNTTTEKQWRQTSSQVKTSTNANTNPQGRQQRHEINVKVSRFGSSKLPQTGRSASTICDKNDVKQSVRLVLDWIETSSWIVNLLITLLKSDWSKINQVFFLLSWNIKQSDFFEKSTMSILKRDQQKSSLSNSKQKKVEVMLKDFG